MSTPEHHQAILHAALGDAIAAAETPEFMTAEKEAEALISSCRTVESLLRDGFCPLVKLMALSQQALRCAAVGYAQSESRKSAIDALIARTVHN